MESISDLFGKTIIYAFFIMLISGLYISSSTLAMPVFDREDGSTIVVPMNVEVLWDQSDNPSNTDIVSQDFIDGAPFDVFDTRAADDFQVPDGMFWLLDSVKVFGTFDGNAPNNLDSLDVVFYEDQGGFPGEIVDRCNFVNVLPVDIDDPSFLINLPTPCPLPPGTYWVSVRANMMFVPNGQWFWNLRTIQTLNPFVWENPGNGFATGCTTFVYAIEDCGADFPDLTFQLMGEEQPFPVVPTLNTIGLIVLFIALGLIMIFHFRKVKKLKRI